MEYIVNHIPLSTPHRRRQGVKCTMTTITIHNTGNPSSNALGERAWLVSPSNDRQASWHIVVDEHRAIEAIPTNEKALHAGAAAGNTTSIGIEICESGDYAKTLQNAAQLVAKMLKERGWGVDRLRRHFDWNGKICPRLMYNGGKWSGWESFKNVVSEYLKEEEPMTKEEKAEFNKLNDQVQQLSSAVATLTMQHKAATESIPAPKWFISEFGESVLNKINDPTGTLDFWRSTAVALRVQGLGR